MDDSNSQTFALVDIFLTRSLSKSLAFCEFASVNFEPLWASFYLRSIALNFLHWVALRFREITYAKTQFSKRHLLEICCRTENKRNPMIILLDMQQTGRPFIFYEVKTKSHKSLAEF